MIRAKVKFGIKISVLVLVCSGLILAISYIKPEQTGAKAEKHNITIMNWIKLEDEQELENIKALSSSQAILIFKHSTRCSISSTAINRLERSWKDEEMKDIKIYYLDLITY